MLKSVYNLLSIAYDWFSIHALIYYGCKWIVFVFNKKTKFSINHMINVLKIRNESLKKSIEVQAVSMVSVWNILKHFHFQE